MRPNFLAKHFLPKSLLAAALGGAVVLGGLGAQSATAAQTSTVGVAAASDDAEFRFFEMQDLFWQICAPDVEDSGELAAPSATETTSVDPIDPVPTDPYDPVPLDATEQCVADRNALRISKAFSGMDTTTYEAVQAKLTSLRYPAARIHRMPDQGGAPRARLDLRLGDDRAALEVTGTYLGVMVETFGASKGVSVTEVLLEPQLDEPTS
ncbi:hypothetical protein JIX56_17900 [Streptomyces sp. CA-210063]|uniref:hypothetical protein n=1 Tax=Streptomyces sp. CA-210063 TaxID=2801029 RepID=UPI00214D0518|nr:hypothetical protein [Streptomyces sp. CA-210063]UUU31632.1 hypothetical protein JIX56_17900 [Streptomyces sp. CA-210063]